MFVCAGRNIKDEYVQVRTRPDERPSVARIRPFEKISTSKPKNASNLVLKIKNVQSG